MKTLATIGVATVLAGFVSTPAYAQAPLSPRHTLALQCLKTRCEHMLPFIDEACARVCVDEANMARNAAAPLPADALDTAVAQENADRRKLADSAPIEVATPEEQRACASAGSQFRAACEQRGGGSCYEGSIQVHTACLTEGFDDESRTARRSALEREALRLRLRKIFDLE